MMSLNNNLNHYKWRTKSFLDLVQTVKIDNSKLLEQLLKAVNVSQQIELFCQTVALNETDLQKRLKIKNNLQQLLRDNGFRSEFHFVGSTANNLAFRDSDIDLFIELNPDSSNGDKQQHRYDYKTAIGYLERIQRTLDRHLNMFVANPIASKRCPIIRLDFNEISSDLEVRNIVCDLSVSNRLAVYNSKLISFYCDIEPRFRQLTLILRYWAKINGFIGTQGFSSYAFTMLCVFFAQNTSPPLLRSVECLMNASNQSLIIDGWECGFSDDKTVSLISEKNIETVNELIASFFKFYSRFDFATQVICPKTAQTVQKSVFICRKIGKSFAKFESDKHCCIQDPFELRHNITANCEYNVFAKFCEYIDCIADNSEKLFAIKPNSSQNVDTYWGIAPLITASNHLTINSL